jgi:hypothetical protein
MEEEKQYNYEPNKKQVEAINRVYNRFEDMRDERDKKRREFDGRTITEYVNDNVDAYNGIVPDEIRETKEAWQSLIFDQKTRAKVKATVANIAAARPYINIVGVSRQDNKNAADMRLVFEDTHKQEEGFYKLYLQTLSACVKGTVIVEEGYKEVKKEVKEITGFNHETGKAKTRKRQIIEGGCGHVYGDIVPLMQFYPNENSAEIEHDCIVLQYMDKEEFDKVYGGYEEAKYVKPGIYTEEIENVKYKQVGDDRTDIIEIMKYYNEDIDEFIVLANGVWLNPQDKDEVCPLPFNHKRLPFVKTVYEIADEDEFYGKALPDIMAGEQETINALLRMTVDQEVLSIHKPIMLGDGAEMDSYQMFPGKTFRMTGDVNQAKELNISGTQQSTFQVLEWLDKKSDVNTAIGSTQMGVHSGRKTAKEAVILDENAKKLSGNFKVFIEHLLFRRAKLRVSNICQFYKEPIQYVVLKDKYGSPLKDRNGNKKTKPKYREITVDDTGKNPFWIDVTPEMCSSKYTVRLNKDVEPPTTRQELLQVATALLEESKANPLIDADEATINFIIRLGLDPDRFYIKPDPKEMQKTMEMGQVPPPGGGVNQPNAPVTGGIPGAEELL